MYGHLLCRRTNTSNYKERSGRERASINEAVTKTIPLTRSGSVGCRRCACGSDRSSRHQAAQTLSEIQRVRLIKQMDYASAQRTLNVQGAWSVT